MVWQADTMDKIVSSYFAAITKEVIEYKGKTYYPKPLKVSPKVSCGVSCPPMCGGCCQKATLDYLPHETFPYRVSQRTIPFNGKTFTIYSDTQEDHDSKWCKHRQSWDGRCAIHPTKPFAADFECVKFFMSTSDTRANQLRSQPFPRKWSYTRVDGEKGGLCETQPVTRESHEDVLRRLRRLCEWADYFEVNHFLYDVVEWLEDGPHEESATFNQTAQGLGSFINTMTFEEQQ